MRIEDAINIIEGLRGILEDSRFKESPYQPYRDRAKVGQTRKILDNLVVQLRDAVKQLAFEGVFIGKWDDVLDTLKR